MMATLYVRHVPDDLYDRLRAAARDTRRSISDAAIEILRAELPRREPVAMEDLVGRARAVRERTRSTTSVAADIRIDRDR